MTPAIQPTDVVMAESPVRGEEEEGMEVDQLPLPTEIFLKIFESNPDPFELARIGQTCAQLRQITHEHSLPRLIKTIIESILNYAQLVTIPRELHGDFNKLKAIFIERKDFQLERDLELYQNMQGFLEELIKKKALKLIAHISVPPVLIQLIGKALFNQKDPLPELRWSNQNLASGNISASFLEAYLIAAEIAEMPVLRLENCRLGPGAGKRIVQFLKASKATTALHLDKVQFQKGELIPLLCALQDASQLEALSLTEAQPTDGEATIKAILDLEVHELRLGGFPISQGCLEGLAERKNLTALSLDSMEIKGSSVKTLMRVISNNPHLKELSLPNNQLGYQSTSNLMGKIERHQGVMLEVFDLSGNQIGDDGLKAISRTLASFPYLKSLRLNRNGISSRSVMPFAQAVPNAKALQHVALLGNSLGYMTLAAIAKHVRKGLQQRFMIEAEHEIVHQDSLERTFHGVSFGGFLE